MKNSLAADLYIILVFLFTTISMLLGNESLMYLSLLVLGIAAFIFQKFVHARPIRELGYKRPSTQYIIYAIVFPLTAILFIGGIGFIMGWIQGVFPETFLSSINLPFKGSWLLLILIFVLFQWILTALINLVTEELIFRGYILNRFRNLGTRKAVLISSLLFGLWHVPVAILIIKSGWLRAGVYAVNISLLGLVFGWLLVKSKSLIPPCIAHGLWNALEYTFWGMGNQTGVFPGTHRILFDPEEGAAGTLVLLIFSLLILINLKKNRNQ